MASDKTILFYASGGSEASGFVARFAESRGLVFDVVAREDDVRAVLNRTYPGCVILDGGGDARQIAALVTSLKVDPFTGIVPLVVTLPEERTDQAVDFLGAGADEVLQAVMPEDERMLRLEQVLRRADRDVSVHPTTRLPGTNHIARDMQNRLDAGQEFAVCYADLDHFKEFNDRYGYAFGDGVIRMLSRILRDMVRGLAPGGFVGHIGGDDFIFNVPLDYL
ncbi:MAG: diguanylate cyclase [Gemmatimonadota bacterium]